MLRRDPSLTAYQPMPGAMKKAPSVVAKYHVGTLPAEEAKRVDLFGKGEPNEFLVCANSQLIAYDADGKQLWSAHQPGYDITEAKWVEDLDGDGTNEVVAAAGNLGRGRQALVAFDAKTGKFRVAVDFTTGSSGWTARCCPFLAEQPGKQILLVQSSRRQKLPYLPRPTGPDGDFSLWRFDGKKFVRQWHIQTTLPPDAILNNPELLVGDIEGDGRIRAVVSSMCHVWYLDPNEGKVLSLTAWRPQQAQRLGPYGWSELLDVDGDGRLDYVNVAALQNVNYLRNTGMKMELGWTRGWRERHVLSQNDITSPSRPWRDLEGDGKMECLFARGEASRGQWEMHVADGESGSDIVTQPNIVPIATIRAGTDEKSGYLLLCARTEGPHLRPVKAHEVWTYQSGKLEQIWSSEKDRFVLKEFEHDDTNTGYRGFRLRMPVTRDVDGDGVAEFFTSRSGDEHPQAWGYDKQKQIVKKPGRPTPPPSTPKVPPQGKQIPYLLAANLNGKPGNELLLYDEDDEKISILQLADGKLKATETMPATSIPICVDVLGSGMPQVLTVDRDDQMNLRVRVNHSQARLRLRDRRKIEEAWQFVFPGSADVSRFGVAVGRFSGEKHWDVIAYAHVPVTRTYMLNGRTGKVVWELGATGHDRPFQPGGGRGSAIDYNGDGADDFLFANPDYLCIVNGRNGERLFGPSELTHMMQWWAAYSTPTLVRNEGEKPLIYLAGAFSCRAALRVAGQADAGAQARPAADIDTLEYEGGGESRGALQPLTPLGGTRRLEEFRGRLPRGLAGLPRVAAASEIQKAWLEYLPSDRWALYDKGIAGFSEGLLPPSKTAGWRAMQVEADGVLKCFDISTGKVRWHLPLSGHSTNIASCDIDGDGKVECLLGTRDGKLMAILDGGKSGEVLWEKQFPAAVGSPILADITGNGKSEIIISVGDGFVYVLGAGD